MDPVVVQGGVEVVKLCLQAAFAAARQAGLSDEEAEELYKSEKERFLKNTAEELPEV